MSVNKVLSEKELAVELGLSPWTVRTLRLQRGLPHFRTSGRVFYRLASVAGSIAIERKNSLEELSGNLTNGRAAFEAELIRASKARLLLMVENASYADIDKSSKNAASRYIVCRVVR